MIEQIPLPADSVDVVISNCVINLSTDKAAVLTEIARVLKPGGRIGDQRRRRRGPARPARSAPSAARYVGCIAGALSKSEYVAGLEAAGFEDVSVEFTHEVADGMHGAIVKARKTARAYAEGLPVVHAGEQCGVLLRPLRKQCSKRGERLFADTEVRPAAALLALDQPRLREHLEVVADRRLAEAERLGEMADAGLVPGLSLDRG